jgi:hypothetical protein
MNMAGVKVGETQMEEEDLSWLKSPVENPKETVVVRLRACRHSTEINQANRLKFNEFSEYIDQPARFVHTSNLPNQGSYTFAAASWLRIMDMNVAYSAKAQFPTSK